MSKKILIVSYTFPPYPGIGGRRWAKFARQLADRNYEIHVICAENPYAENSQWYDNILHPNIKTHFLPVNYPKVILHGTSSFIDKLIYHFWSLLMHYYSKGVKLERTLFWRRQLLKHASQLIEHENIKNVIVTIPPFRLAYYCSLLKKKYRHINLIVDYRDPWTDIKLFHGFKDLAPTRLEYERYMEMETLKTADFIITVSGTMTKNIKIRSPYPERVFTLHNGYDEQEIKIAGIPPPLTNDRYNFIYAGTLYSNLEYIISPLMEYLTHLKKNNASLYHKIYFEFYGNHNKEIKAKLKSYHDEHVIVHGVLPLHVIQEKLRMATFGILMLAPEYEFSFNTKFFEYLANRKPVILFSSLGETSKFITTHRLGAHVNPINFNEEMDKFLTNIDSFITGFNNSFDISRFNITSLTSELEKYLK